MKSQLSSSKEATGKQDLEKGDFQFLEALQQKQTFRYQSRRSALGIGVRLAAGALLVGSLGKFHRAGLRSKEKLRDEYLAKNESKVKESEAAAEKSAGLALAVPLAIHCAVFHKIIYSLAIGLGEEQTPLIPIIKLPELSPEMVKRRGPEILQQIEQLPPAGKTALENMLVSIAQPALNELMFRTFPNKFFKKTGSNLLIGFASSAAFAASHNLVQDPKNFLKHYKELGPIAVSDTIPASQLALGLYLWNVHRDFGALSSFYTEAGTRFIGYLFTQTASVQLLSQLASFSPRVAENITKSLKARH